MPSNLHLSIPSPCNVDRNQFIALSKGSYCHSCEKQVVDYSGFSDRELISALRQNPTGCGSFRENQLNRPLIENELVRRGYSFAAIAMLLAFQLCALGVFAQNSFSKDQFSSPVSLIKPINLSSSTYHMNPTLQSLQIINDAGYPLSHATIAILNDGNEIIGGEATDSSGYVVLKLDAKAKSIRVSYIGYQHVELPTAALKDEVIELSPLSSNLPTATVSARKVESHSTTEGMFGFSQNDKVSSTNEQLNIPKPGLNLYPNPSPGYSTLESELLKDGLLVNVYSSVGNLVLSLPVANNDDSSSFALHLDDKLPSGTYIVELLLKTGSTEVTKWMVVR